MVQEFQGGDWGSQTHFGPFDLPDGDYRISFDWDDSNSETTWDLITESGWILRHGGLRGFTSFRIGEGSVVAIDLEGSPRPNPSGTNPDMGAFENPLGLPVLSADVTLSGTVNSSEDGSVLDEVFIVVIEENNLFTAQGYTDESGAYSFDVVSGMNYYVNLSLFNHEDLNQYVSVPNGEGLTLDFSLAVDQSVQDGLVEGTLRDWYTNAPLSGASVLFAYNDGGNDMETIESVTDENGYFMVQVPGEQDYDLFLYAEGYWVEHDAFFLGSGESQVLNLSLIHI